MPALISVSDKRNLVEFARGLLAAGIEIYSTGGTWRHLSEAGLPVGEVADYTGFPEMMDGRLKTLHPKVHGGILARRNRPDDLAALAKHGIVPFDFVVVNLYPFAATVAKPGVTPGEAIEQIDIGGPTMVRAAAKNHAFVTLATDPSQYEEILAQLRAGGTTTFDLRRRLAAAAFEHTATYDRAIADYFARHTWDESILPAQPSAPHGAPAHAPAPTAGPSPQPAEAITLRLSLRETLRYGENPHQAAALYALPDEALPGGRFANLVAAERLHGKELSYNNLLDLDSALAMVRSLADPAAVVIKHNNPCGAAAGDDLADVTRRALDGDPVSAFGSVLGFNRELDGASAEVLAEPDRFVEAIVAPGFSPAAFEILTTKPKWKANVRLLATGPHENPASANPGTGDANWQYRQISGGFLVQQPDTLADPEAEWQVVTAAQPTPAAWDELRFAWAMCRHVKSNAIVLVRDRALIGVGAGQMSRVDAVEISLRKAGDRSRGAVLASDAFFPFDDSIHQAAAAGITAIIQPGGSRRDAEVIAACNQHGISMIFTGRRHFRH